MRLKWNQAEDIALELLDRFPELDPLSIRFSDLHQWITQLENFKDDPKRSNEAHLEAIQMAWLEEWREAQGLED